MLFCLPGMFSTLINIYLSNPTNNLKLAFNLNILLSSMALKHLLGCRSGAHISAASLSGLQHLAHTYFPKLQIFVERIPWELRSHHPINRQDCISLNASSGTGQHCSAHCLVGPFWTALQIFRAVCLYQLTFHSLERYRSCLQTKWFRVYSCQIGLVPGHIPEGTRLVMRLFQSHFHCLFSSLGTLHALESSAMFSEWHWWAVLGFVGSEALRSVGVLSQRGLQALTLLFSPLLPGSILIFHPRQRPKARTSQSYTRLSKTMNPNNPFLFVNWVAGISLQWRAD